MQPGSRAHPVTAIPDPFHSINSRPFLKIRQRQSTGVPAFVCYCVRSPFRGSDLRNLPLIIEKTSILRYSQ